MSLLNMGGKEIDLLNLRRMEEEMALMNQQAQRLGVTGIDTPQLGQQAPAPVQAPVQAPAPAAAPAPAPAPAQKTGFMQTIKNKMQDPVFMAKLTAGLNSMRYQPDAGIAAQSQAILENELSKQKANQTVQYLRAQGRPDLANIVEQDPTMASEVLKSMLGTQHMAKVGAIQTDPVTGQQYFTEYDPNTGKTRRVDVEGAIGETPAQKAAREAEQAKLLAGRQAAQVRGEDYFDSAQTIGKSIGIMQSARDLAASQDGVMTGVFEQFLPAFDANTKMFESLQADLGIAVINSATFGALSEKELRLALNKDIPLSLKGQELVDYLDSKIAAQNKLYREMNRKARKLQSGITLGQYMDETDAEIQENYRILAAYPTGDPNMTYELWSTLSGADRKAYLEAEE